MAAQTIISNVRDEPIITREGHTIGVRVSFAAESPAARRPHEFQPWLSEHDIAAAGRGWSVPGISLDVRQIRVDGGAGFQLSDYRQPDLRPGRHELTVDMYPHVVQAGMGGEPCLGAGTPPRIPESGALIKLRVAVPAGSYAYYPGGTGKSEETRNPYDIVAMYRAVLGGAIRSCPEQR